MDISVFKMVPSSCSIKIDMQVSPDRIASQRRELRKQITWYPPLRSNKIRRGFDCHHCGFLADAPYEYYSGAPLQPSCRRKNPAVKPILNIIISIHRLCSSRRLTAWNLGIFRRHSSANTCAFEKYWRSSEKDFAEWHSLCVWINSTQQQGGTWAHGLIDAKLQRTNFEPQSWMRT